jgi:hypothetical protein
MRQVARCGSPAFPFIARRRRPLSIRNRDGSRQQSVISGPGGGAAEPLYGRRRWAERIQGQLLAAAALPGNPDGCADPANHHVVATNRMRGWRRGFAAANPYIHFANCGGCGENVVAPAASGRLSPERRGSVKGMRLTAVRRGRQPRHVVPRIGWVRSQAKLAAYHCLPPN